jgi:hypothetical protein
MAIPATKDLPLLVRLSVDLSSIELSDHRGANGAAYSYAR